MAGFDGQSYYNDTPETQKNGVKMDVPLRISRRKVQLGSLLLLVLTASCVLNLSALFYDPFAAWVRIGVPLSLFLGFLGSVWKSKLLRVIGWVGVVFFAIIIIGAVIPGEDYTLGGPGSPPGPPPHLIPDATLRHRFMLFGGIALSLIGCFTWAGMVDRVKTSNKSSPR